MALTRLRTGGIAANAVVAASIAPGAVDITDIADGAVTEAKLATNAVTSVKIEANAITAVQIAANAVTSTQLSGNLDLTGKTVTLPAGVGGKVLQVVNSTVAPSSITTTSTSFVTTGVSISITPSATSSKIIILLTGGGHYVPENSQFCYVTVFRGASTNIGDASKGLENYYATGGSNFEIRSHALSVVDSPNTTSATTYTFFFRKTGGPEAYQFNITDRSELTIIAMEIAA